MENSDSPKKGTQGLNVIALISGGKDSLYSLLHCLANGHNLVALANLHPPLPHTGQKPPADQDALTDQHENATGSGSGSGEEGEEEDMNSYMYQTIGHGVVPLYEEALGVPLYRGPITGSAVHTGRIYPGPSSHGTGQDPVAEAETDAGDETESLIPLLQRIQKAHPEVNAISTGAILSTYQRTRVESVASRLGLVSLSWLWMYPYLPGQVQGTGTSLLDDMASCTCETRIIKVASGGLDQDDLWTNITSADSVARSRLLRRMQRFTEDARAAFLGEGGEYESLALDGPAVLWKKRIQVDDWGVGMDGQGVVIRSKRVVDKQHPEKEVTLEDVPRPALFDPGFAGLLDNLDDHQDEDEMPEPESEPTAETAETARQMLDIKNTVKSPEAITFATVLLRSMDDFSSMNDIYTSLFPNPNPPARATVACDLPAGVNVQISFEYAPDAASKQGLHVQSRSYWAPANIGPYSQSISIPLSGSDSESNLVYVAGQIPLDPASMQIVAGSYAKRAVLALQHLWRIGAAMQVNWWVSAVAYVTAGSSSSGEGKARLAWDAWDKIHNPGNDNEDEDDDEDVDIWDMKYGHGHGHGQGQAQGQGQASLPDFSLARTTPPFLAVQVAGLPRGSDIEWQGLGCHCTTGVDVTTTTSTTTTTIDALTSGVVEIGPEHADSLQQCVEDITHRHASSRLVVYTTVSLPVPVDALVIPCRGVWGRHGRRLIAGIRFM